MAVYIIIITQVSNILRTIRLYMGDGWEISTKSVTFCQFLWLLQSN